MLKKLLLTLIFLLLFCSSVHAQGSLAITNITDNRGDYGGQIPKYEKLEITFAVENTVATNFQFPYDLSTPLGVDSETGISVDAVLTPDNWVTEYQQPAFYYQEYDDQVKGSSEWFYPTGNFYWKVRFAPDRVGNWQFKLKAQDASGTTESQPQSFTVVDAANHGFIKVAEDDQRYFEFDDGSYFPGLGYNMNYNHVHWVNPKLDNEENFEKMGQNGIQLIRIWLSEWGVYGSAWNPWSSIDPSQHALYIGETGMTFDEAYSESDVSMAIYASYNPCMFIGVWKGRPAVKRNTNYRVRVRYKTKWLGEQHVIVPGEPYGFVAKVGGWLWHESDETQRCYYPGTGEVVTPYQNQNTDPNWAILEGSWNSGSNDFLPNFFLTLENMSGGGVFIDYVWIEEDLGGGNYGANIVSKPWMAHHQYFEQRNSYAFDKVLDLAHQNGVYIRPVILEKNDTIPCHIDYNGNYTSTFSNNWFYGDWRNMTKNRWLQQAWWRYLQARWGYSVNIHSWELLNEGDPWNGLHYTQADELGKFMHCDVFGLDGGGWGDDCTYDHPNDHLVSTSNWHSFPKDQFWAHADYVDVDFADYHRYVRSDEPSFTDTANATYWVSMQYGAEQAGGAGKPLIRGEIGFYDSVTDSPTVQFQADIQAVWLHNFIWGGINPGGMIESYWYENYHIYTASFDHRGHYKTYYDFVKDIPLNNGDYEDAQAVSSNANLRAWGQKDLVNGGLHLWIQNKNHTWKKVVDGVIIAPESGTVTMSGFIAGQEYGVEWWSTWAGQKTSEELIAADGNGDLTLTITDLTTDLALRILPEVSPTPTISPTPTPIPTPIPGDVSGDGRVDFEDIRRVLEDWLTANQPEDINGDGEVNGLDFGVVVKNWGLSTP